MSENPAIQSTFDALLCFEVYAASHAFNRIYKPLLDPLGLTYPQYLVMVLLWEQDGRTVGALGQTLELESSTLTPLIKRLETAGHVIRQRDPEDERRVRIFLTDSGAALYAQGKEVPICAAKASGLSLDELISLRDQMRKLRRHLKETPLDGAQ